MKSADLDASAGAALAELETGLKTVRAALQKLERSTGRGVDYRQWSEAKGSVFGELIEAETLDHRHLVGCRVLPSRYHLLDQLPKRATVAEVGTQYGRFTKYILRKTQPRELHLFDLSFDEFERAHTENLPFSVDIHFHEGNSPEMLRRLDRQVFDWVYLDGDHSFEGVMSDLRAVRDKIADGGFIVCNDYTPWSPLEALVYGIPKAVHSFCREFDWKFAAIALHPWGYHDVVLARCGAEDGHPSGI